MSFFGVQEIIENCNYLNALNEEKGASTEILNHLLPYDDPKVRAIEEKLRSAGAISFDMMFNEPTGFHLLSQFLDREAPVHLDKILFLKDAEAYTHMRFESARLKLARLIFERYLIMGEPPVAPEPQNHAKGKAKKKSDLPEEVRKPPPLSVFEALKKKNRERRGEALANGGSSSRANSSASLANIDSPSNATLPGIRSSSATREDLPKPIQMATLSGDRLDPVTPRGVQDPAAESGVKDDEDSQHDADQGDLAENDGDTGSPHETDPNSPIRSNSGIEVKKNLGNKSARSSTVSSPLNRPKSLSISREPTSPMPEPDKELKTGDNSLSAPLQNVPPHWVNSVYVPLEAVMKIARYLDANMAPKAIFKQVAEELKATINKECMPEYYKSAYYKKYVQTKLLEEAHVGPEDFATIRLLGRGGFGTVYACRKIDSGKLYAMKAINKRLIKWKKAVAMTMLERHTLSLVQSRFVCSLSYAFQDKTHLFLIMDLMAGGDLKFHLTKSRNGNIQGFPEPRARFHAAEILLGLEAMHSKNIIFRDLKLENVLLDEEGHCKISDLGLVALYGQKKVNHYAGTPGYIAPEVTKKQPYGPSVDIFSYGVTLYRMLSGKKPFKGHTRQDFDRAVCNDEPVYDADIFSPNAIALLKGLLEKEPKKRLGCGKNGIQAIKDHPFFQSIDWGLLEIGYLDPPFIPSKHDVNANSLEDIGYEDADAKQYEKIQLDDKFKKQIHGFDYVSKQAVRFEIVSALKKQAEEEEQRRKNKKGGGLGGEGKCCTIL